jgi:peptidoglycan hydrolase-like protein with peptidoglycan-binding domain
MQQQLADAGLYEGRIDGIVGPMTIMAMIHYIEASHAA